MKKLTIRLLTSIFIALTLSLIALAGQNPLPVNAADSQPECWAVIAGVADYKFSNIDDLVYSDDNVLDFSRELSPVWGDSHVKSLIDSQATKAGILNAISWLAANTDANDTVLFYFSGHGGSEGYFCPYDYNGYTFSTTISSSELANSFRA